MRKRSQRAIDIFIEGWGRMGSYWGVGKAMAEIQALLYLNGEPMGLEEMADRLKTSRSNISLNVRGLQDLGVVRKVSVPGDRKDYYAADENVAAVARRLAAEKKRRELDPALDIVRRASTELQSENGDDEAVDNSALAERLARLEDLMQGIAGVFDAFIADATIDDREDASVNSISVSESVSQ